MTFGERVTALRTQKAWSQPELAAKAGIPYMTVWRIEANKHRYPRLDIAAKLARTLGVTLDFLCGVYDEPPR